MSEHMRLLRRTAPQTARLERRNVASASSENDQLDAAVQHARGSSGEALDDETLAQMEPRFGHDFSQVRVHANERAAASAQAMGALAYTVGQDIVFDTGQYAPQTREGQRLIAHELAHVVQQERGSVPGTPLTDTLTVSDPSDNFERAADVMAEGALNDDRRSLLPAAPERATSGGLSAADSKVAVQRQPATAAAPAPAGGATRFDPPPELAQGLLPLDAQIVFLNTRPLADAINSRATWPNYTQSDRSWNGWAQIAVLTSPGFWTAPMLANATSGSGIVQPLTVEDISFPGGFLESSVVIKARITNVTFDSADAVGITQSASGGGSVGSSGTVTTTNTLGASGGVKAGDAKSGGELSGGLSASTGTSSGTTGQAGWQGGVQTGSKETEGVRFHFDVEWDVTVYQTFHTGTATTILSLGLGNLAAALEEVPVQHIPPTTSTGGLVRFPKVRCTPLP